MSEMKLYVMSISTDEMFDAIMNKTADGLVSMLKGMSGFVGVHNAEYFHAFLFTSPEARNKAQEKAQEMGYKTAAQMIDAAYVDIGEAFGK